MIHDHALIASLSQYTSDAIFTLRAGCFTDLNPAALALFGATSAGQLVGRHYLERVSATSRPLAETNLEAIFSRNEQLPLHAVTYLKLDETPLEVEVSAFPIVEHGETSMLVLARDMTLHKRRTAALRDSEALYRTLFEQASEGIFLMRENRAVDCNPATLAMFRCTRQHIIGHSPAHFSPEYQPDGRLSQDKAQEKIEAALSGTSQIFEWRHRRMDNTEFDAEIALNLVTIENTPHLQASVRDITQRKLIEAELERFRIDLIARNENLRIINHFSNLLHSSLTLQDILQNVINALLGMSQPPHIAIYLLDNCGKQLSLSASHGFTDKLRETGKTIPLHHSLSGLALADKQILYSPDIVGDERLEPSIQNGMIKMGIHSCVAIPMFYQNQPLGSINMAFTQHHVCSEMELETLAAFSNTVALAIANARHLQSLAYQASHDNLTGLSNRGALHEHFRQAVPQAAPGNTSLILLDLNRFKEINDTFGHHVGDRLLKEVAQRLEQIFQPYRSLVCRLGGDEFAVMLTGMAKHAEADKAALDVVESFKLPFMVEGMALQVGASLGIAHYPEHGADSHNLLRAADVAMYQAKKLSLDAMVYDRSFDNYSPDRLALVSELTQSLDNDSLLLHYQPKLDIASNCIIGFEALVRWQHPRLGMLYPGSFIHLIEMNEVIHPFTRAIMDLAMRDKQLLHQQGYIQPVAINLSARNLLDSRCMSDLEFLLHKHELPHGEIELELTETALMHDPDKAIALLNEIAERGIKIAIDDFGTGYSSLTYLRRMPIKSLKIDCSFVIGMHDNIQDEIIVRSTINLAHSLGLNVIAEGVENAEVLQQLRDMGCDQAQGYFISKPLPLGELLIWLDNGRPAL